MAALHPLTIKQFLLDTFPGCTPLTSGGIKSTAISIEFFDYKLTIITSGGAQEGHTSASYKFFQQWKERKTVFRVILEGNVTTQEEIEGAIVSSKLWILDILESLNNAITPKKYTF